MRFIWCSFVLLATVEFSFTAASLSDIIVNTIGKLTGTRNDNCANNYKHNPDLKLSGYLYTLYTTNEFGCNKVSKFWQKGNDMAYARTTTDGECCSTANFTLGDEKNMYTFASDADCSMKAPADSGEQKIIISNTDTDGSCCFIIWFCREARNGVIAKCDERMISEEQTEWVQKQYDQMGLKPNKVDQSVDYKGGKCFKN